MRNAKIVCTLGPASDDAETIRSLADAGMSVARLNASHGSTDHRRTVIDRVRDVDDELTEPLAVMVDLKGPEVRTAEIDEPVMLETGSEVVFAKGDTSTPEFVGLTVSITECEPGDTILLDDGRIEAHVRRVDGEEVVAEIISGGKLQSRKGVNIPGVDLDIELITEGDERELELAADKQADFVAASFVRDGEDVYKIIDKLEEFGDADIPVIAKIERAGAVENLDSIISAADGVMVARGDLGVECPLEDVPVVQKRIIKKCVDAGVPVITATEMLESMIHSRRPTRAEASDVANAVLDGTDAVMLSGETAIGDHPVRVVETMADIVNGVEETDEYAESVEQRVPSAKDQSRTEALARSARYLARDIGASAVVAASESGYTARKTAKFRPQVPIVATTPNERVRRQLGLVWGVIPRSLEYQESVEHILEGSVQAALDANAAESGDTVVAISGLVSNIDQAQTTNMLKVHVAAEQIASGKQIVGGRVAGPLVRLTDGDLSDVPEGAILSLSTAFDGEFTGDIEKIGGIVDAREGMTGYPAVIARELGIPMLSGAIVPDRIAEGQTLSIDAERGVVFEGNVLRTPRR
ncbi:pyruvate kinase [Halohasta litchfieldiae]|jgi:pyruvate kinase|uniref:Pyruvate kinase n=1 Tax=Halohasta litchfieldiae TaxID=1073996 RepID=A0A1H6RRL4_9EURY|nr:pyruvate kinase [Halohasta litchfieldiae]ATW89717.1 pyruvate kinase [Halohasta litchfieldiae]SEI53802.1 pyruvate kinase [Halohasta litchfieldiae]